MIKDAKDENKRIIGFSTYKANANEAGTQKSSFEVIKDITVGGKSYTIKAKIAYDTPSDSDPSFSR